MLEGSLPVRAHFLSPRQQIQGSQGLGFAITVYSIYTYKLVEQYERSLVMTALINPAMTRLSLALAESRGGRVTLHVACILAGSDPAMHWHGIGRELRRH